MTRTILLALSLVLPIISFARKPIPSSRFESLSGMKSTGNEKNFWDQKYSSDSYLFGKAPAKFLAENYDYIPQDFHVYDLGMGEGRNAVFLAQKGYKVTGIDISSVAIRKANNLAKEFNVRIRTVIASLDNYQFKANSMDSALLYYFLDRKLNKKIINWLKPGGILLFEAYTTNQRKVKGHSKTDRRFLLKPGELLDLFPGMIVLKYEEPLHESNYRASIILMKPKKK